MAMPASPTSTKSGASPFGDCIELPFPSRTVEWLIYHSTVHRLMKVRAASALLPTLFPSPTGSRLSPSSSHGAIHVMAQTGRSNARYVDPQRRYTVVLGPSWNAPFGALPHNDRAGTHDGADGRCGSYAPIGRGQAAMWITSKILSQGVRRCPLCPRKRTSSDMTGMSALCQKRTFALQQIST